MVVIDGDERRDESSDVRTCISRPEESYTSLLPISSASSSPDM